MGLSGTPSWRHCQTGGLATGCLQHFEIKISPHHIDRKLIEVSAAPLQQQARASTSSPAGRRKMIGTLAVWVLAFIFLGYFVPHLIVAWFYKTKNLKKAYNAEWALVTGASSGGCRGGAIQGTRVEPPRRAACPPYLPPARHLPVAAPPLAFLPTVFVVAHTRKPG